MSKIEKEFTKFRKQIGEALKMKGLLGEDIPPTEYILAEIDCLTAGNKELTKACNDKDEALKILSDKIKAKDNALRRIADYGNDPMSLSMASEIAREALKHD